jgi:hypothetical protein
LEEFAGMAPSEFLKVLMQMPHVASFFACIDPQAVSDCHATPGADSKLLGVFCLTFFALQK